MKSCELVKIVTGEILAAKNSLCCRPELLEESEELRLLAERLQEERLQEELLERSREECQRLRKMVEMMTEKK